MLVCTPALQEGMPQQTLHVPDFPPSSQMRGFEEPQEVVSQPRAPRVTRCTWEAHETLTVGSQAGNADAMKSCIIKPGLQSTVSPGAA